MTLPSTTWQNDAPAAEAGSPPSWGPRRVTVVTLLAVAMVAALANSAWRQNFGRAVDPYRAAAVRAGMLDWPIRGNRVHDRAWMRELYGGHDYAHTRLLYAGTTPYGPLTLAEAPPRRLATSPALDIGVGNHGLTALDVELPARPEQVSAIVPVTGDRGIGGQVLLVVGRPGTTRVTWRSSHADGPGMSIPLHHGAGYVTLPWSTGDHMNDVVVTVERAGRVVYEGTVTTLAGQALEYSAEAPAPLVDLPGALTRTAGDRADALAFRDCLVSVYAELPALVAHPPAPMTYEESFRVHRHILRDHLRDLALDPVVGAVDPRDLRHALATPGSAVARAVTKSCVDYDAIGRIGVRLDG